MFRSGRGKVAFSISALLFVFITPTSTAASCGDNSTLADCKNGGVCQGGICVCPDGYSDSSCEYTVLSVAVMVIVCVMPIITWSIICCYGCRSLRAKIRRQNRRHLTARSRPQLPPPDEDSEIPVDDEPPGYYQAVYSNPIAVCGLNENPDWTDRTGDYLELPPHYDDLVTATKAASRSPPPVIIELMASDAVTRSRPVDAEIAREGTTCSPHDRISEDRPTSSAPPVRTPVDSIGNDIIGKEPALALVNAEIERESTTISPHDQISEDRSTSSTSPVEAPAQLNRNEMIRKEPILSEQEIVDDDQSSSEHTTDASSGCRADIEIILRETLH